MFFRNRFHHSSAAFLKRLCRHPHVVATLQSFDIPFGQYRDLESHIIEHIFRLLKIDEDVLSEDDFTEITHLVYVAGKDFHRLESIPGENAKSRGACRFFDPKHMISAIEFNEVKALGILHQFTQFHEIAEDNSRGIVP